MEEKWGTIRRPDNTKDWECYRDCTGYGKWIREAGNTVFDALYQRMENGGKNLLSEYMMLFAGMPYDYKAFRGVTAYIARRAAKVGLCYVASPVIEYTEEHNTIVVKDYEIALIGAEEKEG